MTSYCNKQTVEEALFLLQNLQNIVRQIHFIICLNFNEKVRYSAHLYRH